MKLKIISLVIGATIAAIAATLIAAIVIDLTQVVKRSSRDDVLHDEQSDLVGVAQIVVFFRIEQIEEARHFGFDCRHLAAPAALGRLLGHRQVLALLPVDLRPRERLQFEVFVALLLLLRKSDAQHGIFKKFVGAEVELDDQLVRLLVVAADVGQMFQGRNVLFADQSQHVRRILEDRQPKIVDIGHHLGAFLVQRTAQVQKLAFHGAYLGLVLAVQLAQLLLLLLEQFDALGTFHFSR
jgi:hypothetical protein